MKQKCGSNSGRIYWPVMFIFGLAIVGTGWAIIEWLKVIAPAIIGWRENPLFGIPFAMVVTILTAVVLCVACWAVMILFIIFKVGFKGAWELFRHSCHQRPAKD